MNVQQLGADLDTEASQPLEPRGRKRCVKHLSDVRAAASLTSSTSLAVVSTLHNQHIEDSDVTKQM